MLHRRSLIAAALALLAACDQQRIEKLEEGVATEADVGKQFGEPVAIYTEPDGARTLEYPRQPEGRRNYMITIGTDGKMRALRQVLTPPNFARVTPGLDKAQVRRILGQPAKAQFFELKQQEVWDWRWVDGQSNMVFTATFDRNGRVVGTASGADNADLNVGGK